MSISCNELSIGYGERIILSNVSIDIPPGKITTICGANGCGKSTLLKGLSGTLELSSGDVFYADRPLSELTLNERAKKLAILPQSPTTFSDISVYELLKLGRFPHQSLFQQWSQEDEHIVNDVLQKTQLEGISDQRVSELSGGQRQRAWIALTLVQGADTILLDEPINHLDIHHQVEVLDLLCTLRDEGKTIVLVLHDLNLSARYSDHLIMVANGGIYNYGEPADIITTSTLKNVFSIDAHIIDDPVYGTPLSIPLSKAKS